MLIGFKWLGEGESNGTIELFDEYRFSKDVSNLPIEHRILHSANKFPARRLLTVSGGNVTLDYEAFEEFNIQRDVFLGVTRLVYDPAHPQKIRPVPELPSKATSRLHA